MNEVLGMAFGLMVFCWAVICAYVWVIKPEREARRREADLQLQQRHRSYRGEMAKK